MNFNTLLPSRLLYAVSAKPKYLQANMRYNIILCSTYALVSFMKHLNIREMRSSLGKLDMLVEEEQELIITRNKQAIARVLPVHAAKKRPSHADLRLLQQCSTITSEELIRQDRDER